MFIALLLIAGGLYLLFVTAHDLDRDTLKPRHPGLRVFGGILVVIGGLIILGTLVDKGILR
jgi:hypothetical protein